MVSRLTTVHTQAYQLAYSLALQAQNAYQYELGSSDSFIQSGYWDSQHKGLTAGESLIFDLRRMEAQYLAGNSRELELTKHISLVLTAPMALVMLRKTGVCQIALDEVLFENDHPGQYFRRLRAVAVTIPCVTGPYTGVNATLSLTSAMVRTSAPVAGYIPQSATGPANDPSVVVSPSAAAGTQTIATSSGQNDAGLFDVNLRDDRWLPFEGQGAISTWNLVLDPRDNNFDLSTISDVVLHIRYTARGGGDQTVANVVRSAIKSQVETSRSILVSVRSTFGNAWYSFFNPAGQAGTPQTLTLPLTNVIFPYSNLGSGIKIIGIAFYVAQSGGATGSVAAMFGQTGGTLQSFTLALGDITGAPLTVALASPQSFTLTVPAGSIDPAATSDILLIVNYSID